MSSDATIVFAILAVAGVCFASGRVRLDVTALLVVLALMLSGVLTPREALSGFGDPVILLVAGLLVVGEMLNRTGVAYGLGSWITRVGGASETRLLVLLMLSAAVLSSVMSSTAVVAVFIPVVLTISAKTDLNASQLLMPLSFAALVGGMLTLIATTPNLVVNGELEEKGMEAFGFFSFTPIGLAVLAVAVLYMWLVGRHLLPGGAASPKSDKQTIESGDSLLVLGTWPSISRLQGDTHDFVVLTLPRELDDVALMDGVGDDDARDTARLSVLKRRSDSTGGNLLEGG